jgi:hypothetical protein
VRGKQNKKGEEKKARGVRGKKKEKEGKKRNLEE